MSTTPQQVPADPVSTGTSPEMYQVVVTLPSYAALAAFRDWVSSGACQDAFWRWMSVHGRHI